ncbi:GntR family transcriptional regulator [Planctomicrobium sp. SH661]|uniref:GntR family transcriptional regulator n=1 Tax=Planctomicrobium sp. SH661 TaxID=3448124 RepID=UPI003F5C1AAD
MSGTLTPAASTFDHGLRRERIVREILCGIFTGKFAVGQRMRVETLAEQFEVSATPVREALVELAGIGILDLQPNRGAVLRRFGPVEVHELVQVRRILECEAVLHACDRFAPYELNQLEQELVALENATRDEAWSMKTREFDLRLHNMIAERCGSERLAHEIRRYSTLFSVLRDARHARCQAQANYLHLDENAEHLEIVRAMAAHDPQAAVSAMAYHINQTAPVLIKDLFGPTEA